MSFVEVDLPTFSLFLTFTESDKKENTEFWPNQICLIESLIHSNTFYIVYPGKNGQVHVAHLEQDCLISKKSFKFNFSIHHRITAIFSESCTINKKESQFLFLGYENNTVDICCLAESNDFSYTLIKVQQYTLNVSTKQPVINMRMQGNILIVALAYQISFIEGIFEKNKPINEHKMKFKDEQVSKLNIDLGANYMYLYNDDEGLTVFQLKTLKETARVQDSIRVMATLESITPSDVEIIFIASLDNSIKIIDYTHNSVIKYKGFKNYVNCYFIDEPNDLLWIGTLDGSVAAFIYNPSQLPKSNKKMTMVEDQVKKIMRVCENGIINIFVLGNVMVIKDCEQNIYFFDIIKSAQTTNRTGEGQSTSKMETGRNESQNL